MRTWTVAWLSVFGLSAWSWNAKSELDDSSYSFCRTYLAEDCWLCYESFGFFLPLHIRAKWPFFEQEPQVFPEAGHCDRDPLWSNQQNWQRLLFLSSCVGLGFSLPLGFLMFLLMHSVDLISCRGCRRGYFFHMLGLAVNVFFICSMFQ